MSRILLIHWNAAEAEERARRIEQAGHEVESLSEWSPAALRAIKADPPAAFVIDLGRLPSQGREVGRDGYVECAVDADGDAWIGGRTQTVVEGTIDW